MECEHLTLSKVLLPPDEAVKYRCKQCGQLFDVAEYQIGIVMDTQQK